MKHQVEQNTSLKVKHLVNLFFCLHGFKPLFCLFYLYLSLSFTSWMVVIHQIGGELLFGWNTAYVCLAHGGIKPELHAGEHNI